MCFMPNSIGPSMFQKGYLRSHLSKGSVASRAIFFCKRSLATQAPKRLFLGRFRAKPRAFARSREAVHEASQFGRGAIKTWPCADSKQCPKQKGCNIDPKCPPVSTERQGQSRNLSWLGLVQGYAQANPYLVCWIGGSL